MEKPIINSEKDKIVSDAELGFSYHETITDLPDHRVKETGINRIRRRELLTVPDFIKDSHEGEIYYKVQPHGAPDDRIDFFYDKITDGKFPSARVWDHVLNADTYNTEEKIADHIREGIYFQRIYIGDTHTITTKTEKAKTGIFNLDTMSGESVFNSNIRTPVYFFGNENKNFTDYIRAILQNKYTQEQLIDSEWKDEPLDLIKPDDLDWAAAVDDYELSYLGNEQEGLQERRQNYHDRNIHFIRGKKIAKNIDFLRKLIDGVPIITKDAYRQIPIVQHPDILPLQWCHAEMALVPTKRSLNVLFFEKK